MNNLVIILIILVFFILIYKYNIIELYIDTSKELPIYVVSLEKSKNRRDLLFKDINPEFYYAVNGQYIDTNKIDIGKPNKLTKGEIGCYLSHLHMLKKVYISSPDTSKVLILEDDAKLLITDKEKLLKDLNKITEALPKDWELLFIGHNYYETIGDTIEVKDSEYTLKPINRVHGTQGYLVNTQTLTPDKIKKLYPILIPYDIAASSILKSYALDPKIIELSEHGGSSDTQGIR